MRHACLAAAAALALTALPLADARATPFEPALIPQQAEAAGHLDVDALRATQLFTALGGQGALDEALGKLPTDIRPLVTPLARAARGVSFWHADDRGAVYLATRDPRAVSLLLAKAPLTRGPPVDGIATYFATEGGKRSDGDRGYLAAHGDTLVVANTHEALAQSLRVLTGRGANLVGSRALTTVARSGVFVFVTIGDGVLGSVSQSTRSKLLQLGARSVVLDASEAAGVVTANARAELTSADALAKAKSIVEGMRALASMSDVPGAQKLLDGVQVTSSGLTLAVTARWPVAELKALIAGAHAKP